jgi:hypothetical protein
VLGRRAGCTLIGHQGGGVLAGVVTVDDGRRVFVSVSWPGPAHAPPSSFAGFLRVVP